jgi:phospholipid transport system substrate-binding protein
MFRKNVCCVTITLFMLVFAVFPVWAGVPTEKIRQTSDRILSVVTDPVFKDASKAEERRKLIRKAVDERFDWEEMARRSLGTHWAARTPEEKKEFIDLFGRLLEKTYLDKVEGYAGEKVLYQGETMDGEYSVVNVKIITTKNTEIPVKYSLRQKKDDWLVYDISIEGVSLVNNYRTQFSNILAKSPFGELIKRLKEKTAEK